MKIKAVTSYIDTSEFTVDANDTLNSYSVLLIEYVNVFNSLFLVNTCSNAIAPILIPTTGIHFYNLILCTIL